MNRQVVIYQGQSGAIELQGDAGQGTIWATQSQIAELFGVKQPAVAKHLKNIFNSGELIEDSVHSILEYTANDGKKYKTKFYNLDAIISVGYRINSAKATHFRQWATQVLRQHIIDGYTINRDRITQNYNMFLKAVEEVKQIGRQAQTDDILELIKLFAATWFSLDAYDREALPVRGATSRDVQITADELRQVMSGLRDELIAKKEAGELFGKEKERGSITGIVGNIFQSFGGEDLYPTLEQKAAHLLYFIVKNHPFVDGNKRNGAFAFVWFLQKAGLLDTVRLSPEALTALTLLVAESNPADKERITGLILLLLKR